MPLLCHYSLTTLYTSSGLCYCLHGTPNLLELIRTISLRLNGARRAVVTTLDDHTRMPAVRWIIWLFASLSDVETCSFGGSHPPNIKFQLVNNYVMVNDNYVAINDGVCFAVVSTVFHFYILIHKILKSNISFFLW